MSPAPRDEVSLAAHLETRRARLCPADEDAAPLIYSYLMRLGMHSLPPLDMFASHFMDQMFAMFTIELTKTGQTIGFAALQDESSAGHIDAGIYTDPDCTPRGVGAEAVTLLVNYAFAASGSIRKVFSRSTEASRDGFGIAFDVGLREATLPEHMFFAGRLWDVHVFSVSREDWIQGGARFLRDLLPRQVPAGTGGACPGEVAGDALA